MLKGARKCTKCDSYQDWRRHLTFSTALLALFISFFASITAAYPLIRDAWRKPDSDLRVDSAPVFQNGHVFVLITNAGRKPGVVDLVTVKLKIKNPSNVIYLHLIRPLQNPDVGLIPADRSSQLDFSGLFPATKLAGSAWDPSSLTWDQLMEEERELNAGSCELSVRVTSFKGVESEKQIFPDCWHFQQLLRDYWHEANPDRQR
ncbi:MAG: hypothetical protein M3O31_09600 [Acidobacteriota bacterium]|nr:hypothetical protein [Acidobacteriota bacterium]